MEVVRDVEECEPGVGSVVTIGAYDGVHRGHRAVIAEVRRRAAAAGVASAVVTFDRHPASVVRPESAPRLLTDLEQKLELLDATGIDRCLVIAFDERRSHEPAEEFVREVLVGALGARCVVVGEDFHFGHQRKGNVELLRAMGADLGFEVEPLALVDEHGRPADGDSLRASSTAIRHALVEGDLAAAERMLGRRYEVRGKVTPGDGHASTVGVPTANVSVPGDILLPAVGTYAGVLERVDGSSHGAVLLLGRHLAFFQEAHANLLEAHLLDFDGDLAEEHVRVRFVARLRPDVPVADERELARQIALDRDDARKILA